MKKSELDQINTFAKKLENYPYNLSNKKAVFDFIKNLNSKIKTNLGQDNFLITKLNEIVFVPKSYFPEMKENEITKTWALGINQLMLVINEIKEQSKAFFDFSDISTLEYVLTQAIESDRIEFKSTLRWDLRENKENKELEKVVLKTISSFNNSEGGNLFIGVSDNGQILGLGDDYKNKLKNRDQFELHLRNLLNNTYSVSYVVENIKIDFPKPKEIEICQVTVNKGKKALFLDVTNSNGNDKKERFYIRNGNQSVEIEKTSEIVNYAISRFGLKQ